MERNAKNEELYKHLEPDDLIHYFTPLDFGISSKNTKKLKRNITPNAFSKMKEKGNFIKKKYPKKGKEIINNLSNNYNTNKSGYSSYNIDNEIDLEKYGLEKKSENVKKIFLF